jgi:hypothetical protein
MKHPTRRRNNSRGSVFAISDVSDTVETGEEDEETECHTEFCMETCVFEDGCRRIEKLPSRPMKESRCFVATRTGDTSVL